MPMACILVFAVLAAAPPLPGQLSRTVALRTTHSEARRRATLATRASDPPRWSSGYRAAQLDLRWHAPDADRIDASAAPPHRPSQPRESAPRPIAVAALAELPCRAGSAAITASCPR
jgi:hypothetical protein